LCFNTEASHVADPLYSENINGRLVRKTTNSYRVDM